MHVLLTHTHYTTSKVTKKKAASHALSKYDRYHKVHCACAQ